MMPSHAAGAGTLVFSSAGIALKIYVVGLVLTKIRIQRAWMRLIGTKVSLKNSNGTTINVAAWAARPLRVRSATATA